MGVKIGGKLLGLNFRLEFDCGTQSPRTLIGIESRRLPYSTSLGDGAGGGGWGCLAPTLILSVRGRGRRGVFPRRVQQLTAPAVRSDGEPKTNFGRLMLLEFPQLFLRMEGLLRGGSGQTFAS